MKELRFKLHYEGGEADNNRLDCYDSSVSILGFSKLLNITVNSLIRKQVLYRKTDLKGVNYYILPSKKGSFLQELIVQLTPELVVAGVTLNILSNAIYDLVKCMISNSVNKHIEPSTKYVKDLCDRKEPFFDDLLSAIEVPIQEVHQTIKNNSDSLTISKSREPIISLNIETKDYVSDVITKSDVKIVEGNITRYNILSKKGRMFSTKEDRTLSFDATELQKNESILLSGLLHKANIDNDNKVKFKVNEVVTPRGNVKRYIMLGVISEDNKK